MRHIYELYRVLAPIMPPSVANEHELWELAAVLGVDAGNIPIADLDERLATEATPEQLAVRVAKSRVKPRRHGPPPEDSGPVPEPVGEVTDMTDTVMRQMGIRTV